MRDCKRGDARSFGSMFILMLLLSILLVSASNDTNVTNGTLLSNNPPEVELIINDTEPEVLSDNETLQANETESVEEPEAAAPRESEPIVLEEIDLKITDANGDRQDAEVFNLGKVEGLVGTRTSDPYKVGVVPAEGPVQKIVFDDLQIDSALELGIDDTPESIDAPLGVWQEVYAINPEELEFTTAEVTVIATGTSLYKCKEWDFGNQACDGTWEHFMDVTPGEEYTFILTPDDPGFGEIIATAAVHLDEDYEFISDIFSDITAEDDIWSEPIYEGEYVRVTFEENLTNGSLIDVIARSNDTIAYFDVYEAGTSHKVSRSAVVGREELQYMEVTNLTQPTSLFDFKIVKIVTNESEVELCQNECLSQCDDAEDEECTLDCSESCTMRTADAERVVFLEFDYIHDDVINLTHADGVIVYSELDVTTPRYRTWNETDDFSTELSTQSLGTGNSHARWTVVRANHERDEIILGTLDQLVDVNVQILDSLGNWGNLTELTATAENAAQRGFDIAYEDISGDALIVYEDSNAAGNNDVAYVIWNGSNYSSETLLDTTLADGEVRWITLVPRPGTDQVMLLVHNDLNDLYAVLWNGTDFDQTFDVIASTGTTSINEQHFGFEWEQSSGQGLLIYGETDLTYRVYDPTGGFGGSEFTITTGALDQVRLCADPTSDHIGIIWQDSGNDVNVRMWNGSAILASPPSQDAGTENSGGNNPNIDCAWDKNGTYALFGFIDANALSMDYVNFTKTNTWSTSALTSTQNTGNFASDDIKGLRFVEHPTTNEIMVVALDVTNNGDDVTTIRWDGSSFQTIASSPLEDTIECTSGTRECAQFDWYRYDSVPSVSSINPSGTGFAPSSAVPINVTISDNIAVGTVTANITIPGGAINQITLTDANSDGVYNGTFTNTSTSGLYTVRIIAFDTSTHQNVNATETDTFTIFETTPPNVTNLVPTAGSSFLINQVIEIAANASDEVAVDTVFANISLPNGTIQQVTLTNASGLNEFNNTFTIPLVYGTYNITIVANDTQGNVNATETTNFTVAIDIGQSGTFLDDGSTITQNSFLNGTFVATLFNDTNNAVVLNASAVGNFTSEIFDAGSLVPWNNITWNQNVFVGFDLPDNGVVESLLGGANMTDNILLMHLDESSGTLSGTSPTGASGTAFGGVTYGDPGRFGSALTFDGTSGYVALDHSFTESGELPQVTACAWFNTTFSGAAFTDNWALLDYDRSEYFNLYIHGNGSVSFSTATSSVDIDDLSGSGAANDGEWHLGCGVYDGTDKYVYLDGLEVGSSLNAHSGNPLGSGTDRFGFIGDGSEAPTENGARNNIYYQGSVDEVAMWNRTLSATEILNLHKRAVLRSNFKVRSCNDSSCSGESFVNIPDTPPQTLNISANRYFQYAATFSSNDTNYTSELLNVTIVYGSDVSNPAVFNLVPVAGGSATPSQVLAIEANVTDNIAVDTVYANISLPNGSIQQITLTNASGSEEFNNTFTVPGLQGTFNVSFFANDTSGNINTSETTNFTVTDAQNPSVNLVSPSAASTFNISNSIELAVNATDDSAVGSVRANVTFPNGTVQQLTLTLASAPLYNTSFTAPGLIGVYTVVFIANDTAGNQNTTATTNFTVQDVVNPAVTTLVPTAGSAFNVSNSIEIAANVSDDSIVDVVFVNITFPNGTVQQLTLTNASGLNEFNNTFTAPALLGTYVVTYVANDTSSNSNATEVTNFTVQDVVNPAVTIVLPLIGSSYSQGSDVFVTILVTDDIAVANGTINVTLPNGSIAQQNLVNAGGGSYTATYNQTADSGVYTLRAIANDTSSNVNSSRTRQFTIVDTSDPIVALESPETNSRFSISTVNLVCNATDSSGLANITLYHNLSSSFVSNQTTSLSGTSNQTNFTLTSIADGTYVWNCLASDNSSNTAFGSSNFTFVVDTTNPAVVDAIPSSGSSFNISNTVEIAANASDNFAVDTVRANVTFPNGTIQQLTLSLASGSKYNSSFTAPALLGIYNVTYSVNDTTGNFNTSLTTNFSVQDADSLSVTIDVCSPDPANVSQSVVCNVTVTDDISVGTVVANVTAPNATVYSQSISSSGSSYNFTFTQTLIPGTYNVSWLANDTSSNVQNATDSFVINDVVNPAVTTLVPTAGSTFNISNSIEIAANASDDVAVDVVFVNITYPNGTIQQLTLTNASGLNEFNSSFTAPALLGTYVVTYVANDTSSNSNATEVTNFTVQDVVNPAVATLVPTAGSNVSVSSTLEIAANVSDDIAVDTVFANISLPNGSVQQLTLTNASGLNEFNGTFTTALVVGTHNVTIIANDTSGNSNSTELTNFTVQDTDSPTFAGSVCVPSSINLSQSTNCSITAADNVGLANVTAVVTLPNGTTESQTLATSGSSYSFNFTNSRGNVGQYNVTWTANDTSSNQNTFNTSFNVSDVTNPSITFTSPADQFNTSFTSVNFTFTPSDNFDTTLNCSVTVNGTIRDTNVSSSNATSTVLTASSLTETTYMGNVTCADSSGNTNTTSEITFRVDTSAPSFITLNTTPLSADDLDPGVLITAFANVTDLTTAVHTVILQYKLSNQSTYTNSSMTFNTSTELYNASFNATTAGIYNLRLIANDTVGNNATSNLVNVTVALDQNWNRSPSAFTPVFADILQSVVVGNLTINNTGDFTLNFSVGSDSSSSVFNDSTVFNLTAKEVKVLQINDSTNTSGVKLVTITINTTTANTTPTTLQTTATIVSAPNQPVLVVEFTDPTQESVSITQGTEGYAFTAKVTNIGEGNATNVTFFFSAPSEWEVTSGDLNTSLGDLDAGDSEEFSIEFTIPDNATLGTQTVIANATGDNATGANLSSLNLLFGDLISVKIKEPAPALGTAGGSGGVGSGGGSGGGSSGGGGGGSRVGEVTEGGAVRKVDAGLGETIYTTDVIEIVRGESDQIPFVVTNLYENSIFENVQVDVLGFMSQYITLTPQFDIAETVYVESRTVALTFEGESLPFSFESVGPHTITADTIGSDFATITIASDPQQITLSEGETLPLDLTGDGIFDIDVVLVRILDGVADMRVHLLGEGDSNRLYFLQSRDYLMDIFVPGYLEREDYQSLTIRIQADMLATNPTLAGFVKQPFVEYRKIIFDIREVDPAEVASLLEEARQAVAAMKEAGHPLTRIEPLFEEAEAAFNVRNFEESFVLCKEVIDLKNLAFEAHEQITDVEAKIKKAEEQWLKVPQTKSIIALASKAFEREDFATALQRAKEAQLNLLLETKGRVNLFWFISTYWWAILLTLLAVSVVGFFAYKKLMILHINFRLRSLLKEELSIHKLVKETQHKHFKQQDLSSAEYHTLMAKYENRLHVIHQLRVKLRNKKISALKTDQAVKDLNKERDDLKHLLKQSQQDYLQKGKISRATFLERYESDKLRMVEVEEEKELMKEKLAKKKKTRLYTVEVWFARLITAIEKHIPTPKKKAKKRKKKVRRY